MSIPTLTKEDCLSIKDINTVIYDRKLTEDEFDDWIVTLNTDAVGFAKLYILQDFQDYIESDAWRNIIKLYIRWNVFEQGYSDIWHILATNSYEQLINLLTRTNENFTAQASNLVVPNKRKNFTVVNPS